MQVKRPQENIEAKIVNNLAPQSLIIGFLDPQISSINHIKKYQRNKLTTFAWELLPQNIETISFDATSKMSRITGEIIVEEFINTDRNLQNKTVLVIGIGNAGLAAIKHAVDNKALVTGVSTSKRYKKIIESWGCHFIQLKSSDDSSKNIKQHQQQIKSLLLNAKPSFDLIVCCARYRGQKAPMLISTETLMSLKKRTVFYDLTASSGGNCEGNQYGKTVTIGKAEIRSFTGYPQKKPRVSSCLYAQCMSELLSLVLSKNNDRLDYINKLYNKSYLTHKGLINPMIFDAQNSDDFACKLQQWSNYFARETITK